MPALIDIENHPELIDWLRRTGRVAPAEAPACRTLAGGVSNRTVLVELADGRAWVLKQALAKLRTAVDWYCDPARVAREALGIACLNDLIPGRVPRLVFEDPSQHLLAMEAVPRPHENLKTLLLTGQVDDGLIRQAAVLLADVHARSHARRAALPEAFGDRSYFEALRLEPYYLYTASQVPDASGFMNDLVARTRRRTLALVHGDYSPKNMLVHAGRVVLLDHEVIHVGDASFDVGFFSAHLLSKARHVAASRPAFVAAAGRFWEAYASHVAAGGLADADLESMSVRQTLGCLLARVAGRSTLEYLSPAERAAQQRDVLRLVAAPPERFAALLEAWDACLC